jgi:hypothetical protein
VLLRKSPWRRSLLHRTPEVLDLQVKGPLRHICP